MHILSRNVWAAALGCTLGWGIELAADVTLNIDAGILRTQDNAPIGNDSLLILAASTTDSAFGAPTPASFLSGDDVELYRWSLGGDFGAGYTQPTALSLTPSQMLEISPNLSYNDPIQLYWFPTLTVGASSPGAETLYGTYRTDLAVGDSIPWFFPSGPQVTDPSGTFTLSFLTTSAGGAIDDSFGVANLTVVPEPATYTLFAGLACAAIAGLSRHRKSTGR